MPCSPAGGAGGVVETRHAAGESRAPQMSPRWTTQRQREWRSTEHNHYAASTLLPVTPLTPVRGACLECSYSLLSTSPTRNTVAHLHAVCTPHSRCWLTALARRGRDGFGTEFASPVELAFQPSRR